MLLNWPPTPTPPLPQDTPSPVGLKTLHSFKESKAGIGLPIHLICMLRWIPPFYRDCSKWQETELANGRRASERSLGAGCRKESAVTRNAAGLLSFASLISAIFAFFSKKVQYHLANLGASSTISISVKKVVPKSKPCFQAFLSFYALESSIVKNQKCI